jgi:regulator of replication initiation timing
MTEQELITKLKTELDASTTWNKCLESTFAREIARVNTAMMGAFDERNALRKELEALKKQVDKQNKKQHEAKKETPQ